MEEIAKSLQNTSQVTQTNQIRQMEKANERGEKFEAGPTQNVIMNIENESTNGEATRTVNKE